MSKRVKALVASVVVAATLCVGAAAVADTTSNPTQQVAIAKSRCC
jgi:hypothetical protein